MHECPDCFEACYCGGDIDDMLMNGTAEELNCVHRCDPNDDDDIGDLDEIVKESA